MVSQAAFHAKVPWICYCFRMHSALVRYHEIALKRGNRAYFVEHLKRNLSTALRGMGLKEIRNASGRLLLNFNHDVPADELTDRLGRVFGIANFSLVERTENDVAVLGARILEALAGTVLRLLSRQDPARRQTLSADLQRHQPGAGRPGPGPLGSARGPDPARVDGVGGDPSIQRVLEPAARAGTRRPAGGHQRAARIAHLRRHRFAGGLLPDDAARLPSHLRPLPQQPVPRPLVPGEGQDAGGHAHPVINTTRGSISFPSARSNDGSLPPCSARSAS